MIVVNEEKVELRKELASFFSGCNVVGDILKKRTSKSLLDMWMDGSSVDTAKFNLIIGDKHFYNEIEFASNILKIIKNEDYGIYKFAPSEKYTVFIGHNDDSVVIKYKGDTYYV